MHIPFDLDRRSLLGFAALVAGTASTLVISPEALATASRQGPRFLGKKPYATMSALADMIIPETDTPGALGANVPALLDAMLLNWASAEKREQAVRALIALDAASMEKGKTFVALSNEERAVVLTDFEKAALKPVPPKPGAKSGVKTGLGLTSEVADPGYLTLKTLVITLYYSSEIALTQELVYEHVPGKWEPSIKILPGMRPFASTGAF
jgi:hypothetical protein